MGDIAPIFPLTIIARFWKFVLYAARTEIRLCRGSSPCHGKGAGKKEKNKPANASPNGLWIIELAYVQPFGQHGGVVGLKVEGGIEEHPGG